MMEMSAATAAREILRLARTPLLAEHDVELLDWAGIRSRYDAMSSGEQAIVRIAQGLWANTDEGKSFVGARGDSGGGADPGKGGPDTGANPWKRETLNLTEQARIDREDPQRAERLRKAAGAA